MSGPQPNSIRLAKNLDDQPSYRQTQRNRVDQNLDRMSLKYKLKNIFSKHYIRKKDSEENKVSNINIQHVCFIYREFLGLVCVRPLIAEADALGLSWDLAFFSQKQQLQECFFYSNKNYGVNF